MISLKRGFLFIVIFLAICIAALLFTSLFLPNYIESYLLTKIASQTGLQTVQAKIRRIGLSGIDIENIAFGTPESPFLSVGSFTIDYSLGELRQRHIEKISLEGVSLNCAFTEGNLSLSGFPPPIGKHKSTISKPPHLPISLGQLTIRNSLLNLQYHNQLVKIPFDLLIEQPAPQKLHGRLTLFPRDQKLVIISDIDISSNQSLIKLSATSFALEPFTDLLDLPAGITITSNLDIDSNATIQMTPFQLQELTASIKSSDFALRSEAVSLQNVQENPLHIKINGNGEQVEVEVENLLLSTDTILFSGKTNLTLSVSEQKLSGKGKLSGTLNQPKNRVDSFLPEPVNIALDFNGEMLQDNSWKFHLADDMPSDIISLQLDNAQLSIRKPQITLSGSGDFLSGTLKHQLTGEIHLSQGKTQSRSRFDMTGSINLRGKQNLLENISGKLTTKMPDITVSASENNARSNLSITGTYIAGKNAPFSIDLTGHLADTSITASQHDITISNVSGNVSLVWPLDRSSTKETIFVDSITWKDKAIGNMEVSIQQHGSMLQFTGTHTNKLLPGLKLHFNGGYQSAISAQQDNFTLLFNSEYEAQSIDLSEIISLPELIFVDGRLQVHGKISGTSSAPRGSLQIQINDGLIEIPGQDIAVEGIKTSLHLPQLLPIRSAPAQLLHFDALTAGDISFANGAVTYQLESPDVLFIEKSSVHWGNGQLNTYNLRLTNKQKEYNINLYAEQLSLGEILKQFGISDAGGEGSVNGRISLHLKDREINIHDSFLYSTPGQGGSIKLSGTEIITGGMPIDAPGYSQLDFAAEALKEFKYNWVKLNFANEAEYLVMKMEMDGRPGRRLPFRYDSQEGTFIRIEEKDLTTGIYQPIRLDVNFKLPLNTILEYKKGIDDLIDSFQ